MPYKHKLMGIYKIEDLDGRVYIGSALDIMSRKSRHKHALKNNSHPNKFLQSSANKYGLSYFRFSILEIITCKEDLIRKEQLWLDILFSSLERKDIYNVLTVVHSSLGYKHNVEVVESFKNRRSSNETKRKISDANKGKVAWNKGMPLSENQKAILSEKRKKDFILRSPNGELIEIHGLRNFANELGVDNAAMSRVALGRQRMAYGWTNPQYDDKFKKRIKS